MDGKFKLEKEDSQRELLDVSKISTDELNSSIRRGF